MSFALASGRITSLAYRALIHRQTTLAQPIAGVAERVVAVVTSDALFAGAAVGVAQIARGAVS